MKKHLFTLFLFIPVLVKAQNPQMDPPAIIKMDLLGTSSGGRFGPYFIYPEVIQSDFDNGFIEFNISVSPPGYFYFHGTAHKKDTTFSVTKGFDYSGFNPTPFVTPTIQNDRIIVVNNFASSGTDSVFIFDHSLNQGSSFAIDLTNLKGKRIDGNSLVTYRNKEEGFSIDYYNLNSGTLDSSRTVNDSLLSVKNIGNRSMLIAKNGYSVHRFDSTTNSYSLFTHSMELPAEKWQHGKDNSFNSGEPEKLIFYSTGTGESKTTSIANELLLADEQTNGFVALNQNHIIYYDNDLQEVSRFSLPENLQNADKVFLQDAHLIIQKSNTFGLFDLNGQLILEKELESPFENITLKATDGFIFLAIDKTLLKVSQQGQLVWQKDFPGGYIKDLLVNNDESLFVYHIDFEVSEAALFTLEDDEGRCQLKPQVNPIPSEICQPTDGELHQFSATFNGERIFTMRSSSPSPNFEPKFINSGITYNWYKDGTLDYSGSYYDPEPGHFYELEISQGSCNSKTDEVFYDFPGNNDLMNPVLNILTDPEFIGDELVFNGRCTNSTPILFLDSAESGFGNADVSKIIEQEKTEISLLCKSTFGYKYIPANDQHGPLSKELVCYSDKTTANIVVLDPSKVLASEKDFELNIYPNPATQFIQIKSSQNEKLKNLEIYNSKGVRVSHYSENTISADQTFRLDQSLFSSGTYVLRMNFGSKVFTKKLIVR